MKRNVVALGLVLLLVVTAPALQSRPALAADASLPVAALHVVERNYFRSIDPIRLLNAAIAALRRATNFTEQVIPDIAGGVAPVDAIRTFNSAFSKAAKTGTMPETDLAYTATREMLASLHDTHVWYMTPAQYKEFKDSQQGKPGFTGIGVNIILRQDADGPFVFDVFSGSPAAAAGIKKFDQIVQVDGASLKGLTIRAASDKIRGPSGSTARLVIRRGDQSLDIAVVRAPIRFRTVDVEMIHHGVAYLRIRAFEKGTAGEFRHALRSLGNLGDLRAAILDLRGNTGGLFVELRSVAGVFLPSETVLARTLTRMAPPGALISTGSVLLPHARLVVLVDHNTASSGEVLTLGLKDAGRATIMGEKTAGAFGGANDFSLPEGGMLVTTFQLVGPHYEQVEGAGILPDTEVALSADDMLHGRDPQLSAGLAAVGAGAVPWSPALAA